MFKKTLCFFALSLSLASTMVWADRVQDGVSLNINAGLTASTPFLAIDPTSGTPHVIWNESAPNTYTGSQVYVKYWNRSNWLLNGSSSLNLNTKHYTDAYARLVFGGGTLYAAWAESPSLSYSNNQIYVKHWNGADWVQDGGSANISAAEQAAYPPPAVVQGQLYVAFSEYSSGAFQLCVRRLDKI